MIEVALSKTYSEKEAKEIEKMFCDLCDAKVNRSLVGEGAVKNQHEIFISFDDFEKLDRQKLKGILLEHTRNSWDNFWN